MRQRLILLTTLGLALSAPAVHAAGAKKHPIIVTEAMDDALKRARQDEDVFDYDKAEAIYTQLLQQDNHRYARTTAYICNCLANAQIQDGDDSGAQGSITKALKFDPGNSYALELRHFLRYQHDWPRGKPIPTNYIALRDVGSAGRLVATNGILHIFVRGKNTEPWSDFQIAQAKLAIEQSNEWLDHQTASREVEPRPSFEHQFLVLPEEPFWRSVDVPSPRQTEEYREDWEKQVLKRFSADSYRSLFEQAFGSSTFRNSAVVFHANLHSRAFAIPQCVATGTADLETAFVYFPVTRIINPLQAVVYSHELMHLYGADDLYNKADDPGAPDQELMKFGSCRLERCILSPITVYAIGWTDEQPKMKTLHILTQVLDEQTY